MTPVLIPVDAPTPAAARAFNPGDRVYVTVHIHGECTFQQAGTVTRWSFDLDGYEGSPLVVPWYLVRFNTEHVSRFWPEHMLTLVESAAVTDFDDEPTDPDIDMQAKVERADAYERHARARRQLERVRRRNVGASSWWERK